MQEKLLQQLASHMQEWEPTGREEAHRIQQNSIVETGSPTNSPEHGNKERKQSTSDNCMTQ